jgi:hypothetical protein
MIDEFSLFCATVKESVVPTFADHLWEYLKREYLKRPDVIERIKTWDAALARVKEALRGPCNEISAAIQRVAESEPSRGYEPMLVERGAHPIVARMMARLLVRRGTRIAHESEWYPRVVDAIRFLATPGRRRSAIVTRAQFLLAAWERTSIIETIFGAAGLDVFEFIEALKLAVEGDQIAWRRVSEIAASIAPHASIQRGPKVRAASAAHEFLLEETGQLTGSRAYTWSDDKGNDDRGDFTDPLTKATRLEFDQPDFDPRPAHRRVKARGAK